MIVATKPADRVEVPRRILELGSGATAAYVALCAHAERLPDGSYASTPSRGELARMCKVEPPTMLRWLRRLADAGAITVSGRVAPTGGRLSNVYLLHW